MYISDIKRYISEPRHRTIAAYVLISLLCIVFSAVYESFSHQVYTKYMTCMFLFPLIGGALVYTLLLISKAPWPCRIAYNAYNSAIAALTVGSTVKGVFIIAGTNSPFWPVFWIVGGLLAAVAIASYTIQIIRARG